VEPEKQAREGIRKIRTGRGRCLLPRLESREDVSEGKTDADLWGLAGIRAESKRSRSVSNREKETEMPNPIERREQERTGKLGPHHRFSPDKAGEKGE